MDGGPARKEPDSLERGFPLGQAVGLALSPCRVPGWSGRQGSPPVGAEEISEVEI